MLILLNRAEEKLSVHREIAKRNTDMFSFFQTFIIKHCNAITTKNEFSLYRKSRENKDEKKWIGKT